MSAASGVVLRSESARDPLAAERLSDDIRAALDWRRTVPAILLRDRAGREEAFTGAAFLTAAEAHLADWANRFGRAPQTFVVALPYGALFLTALLAGLLRGHTIAPLAIPRRPDERDKLRHMVATARASAVLTDRAQSPRIAAMLRGRAPPVVGIDTPMAAPVRTAGSAIGEMERTT